MHRRAETAFPIHDLIGMRWSPRAFADQPVEPEKLGSLIEAARWAPSSHDEQPWSFLVATSDDEPGHEALASCLLEGNAWARGAPVLMLSTATLAFARDGKPNRHAFHDVGLAVENLVLQAQALGLASHQIAGFDVERARELLSIPRGVEPVAMIALGYRGDPDVLPEALRGREVAPRSRRAFSSVAFGAGWGSPLRLDAR